MMRGHVMALLLLCIICCSLLHPVHPLEGQISDVKIFHVVVLPAPKNCEHFAKGGATCLEICRYQAVDWGCDAWWTRKWVTRGVGSCEIAILLKFGPGCERTIHEACILMCTFTSLGTKLMQNQIIFDPALFGMNLRMPCKKFELQQTCGHQGASKTMQQWGHVGILFPSQADREFTKGTGTLQQSHTLPKRGA